MRNLSTAGRSKPFRWAASLAALVLLAPLAIPPAVAACAAMSESEAGACAHCGPKATAPTAESAKAGAPSCHGGGSEARADEGSTECPSSTATRSCCEISAAREAAVVPQIAVSLPEGPRDLSFALAEHAVETGVLSATTASLLERSRGTPSDNLPPAEYLSNFLRL